MGSEGEAEEWVPRKDPLCGELWELPGRVFGSYQSGISQVRSRLAPAGLSPGTALCSEHRLEFQPGGQGPALWDPLVMPA